VHVLAPPRALRLSLALACLTALAACSAPHKLISARRTSCPVRKLEIRDLVSAPDREDWIAVCGERSFACSTREQGRRLVYACRPLASADAGDAISAESADASQRSRVESAPDASTAPADAALSSDADPGAPSVDPPGPSAYR
jgi:hypothetical protein